MFELWRRHVFLPLKIWHFLTHFSIILYVEFVIQHDKPLDALLADIKFKIKNFYKLSINKSAFSNNAQDTDVLNSVTFLWPLVSVIRLVMISKRLESYTSILLSVICVVWSYWQFNWKICGFSKKNIYMYVNFNYLFLPHVHKCVPLEWIKMQKCFFCTEQNKLGSK